MKVGQVFTIGVCVGGILGGTACQSPPSLPGSKPVDSRSENTEEKQGERPPSFVVRVLPVPPRSGTYLTAIVEQQRPSPTELFEYHWMKNGVEIQGEGNVLPRSLLKRGDVIDVTAKSVKTGKEYVSSPVTIANGLPAITSASLLPTPLVRDKGVRVEATATDPDGDPIMYTYVWKRNGNEIAGAKDGEMDISGFDLGDSVEVTVIPRDASEEGLPVHLPIVTITNGPPRITSSPPRPVDADGIYRYQVTAKDPDGDPITFSLSSPPPGMTINETTGFLTWRVPSLEHEQEFLVEIQVSDPKGAVSIQKIPLKVHPRIASPGQK